MAKFVSFIFFVVLVAPLFAEPSGFRVDSFRVIKTSGSDQKAVIKTSNGKMSMIGVGDQIGQDSKVIDIADDVVVLEQMTEHGPEKIIIRLENGKQHVEKITQAKPKRPSMQRPVVKSTSVKKKQ